MSACIADRGLLARVAPLVQRATINMTTRGNPVCGVARRRMVLGVRTPPPKRTSMGLERAASGAVRVRMELGVRIVRRACMHTKTRDLSGRRGDRSRISYTHTPFCI